MKSLILSITVLVLAGCSVKQHPGDVIRICHITGTATWTPNQIVRIKGVLYAQTFVGDSETNQKIALDANIDQLCPLEQQY